MDKKHYNKDKQMDELKRTMNEHFSREGPPDKTSQEAYDSEVDNSKQKSKGRQSVPPKRQNGLLTMLMLMLIPPPFGYLITKLTGRRVKWYQHLIAFMIGGGTFLVLFFLLFLLPMQQNVVDYLKLRSLKKKADFKIEQQTQGKVPRNSFNIEIDSESTDPDYSGDTGYLDYDKLDALGGDARARAQRYQLICYVADMFNMDPILFYGTIACESTCNLGPTKDIYQEAVDYNVSPNQWGCAGICQITIGDQMKHEAYAFECKYSTRQGSPKNDSVAVLTKDGKEDPYSCGRMASDCKPKDVIPSSHGSWPVDSPSLATQEKEWMQNITYTDTMKKLLTMGDKNKGARVRPCIYYMPDLVYSAYVRIATLRNTLDKKAKEVVSKGSGTLNIGYDTKMTVSDCQKYLSSSDSQRGEVAFAYYCDWYLGSLGANYPTGFHSLGQSVLAIQSVNGGTVLLRESLDTDSVWKKVLGTNGNSTRVTVSGSLYEKAGYKSKLQQVLSNAGSEPKLAYTYGVRGMNLGYKYMMEDKAIYDKCLIMQSNGGKTKGKYTKIIALTWEEANKMFPRADQGGPGILNCIDVDTGKEYTLQRTTGHNHADCEPVTAQDTATLKEVNGGAWNWTHIGTRNRMNPTLIKGNGVLYACSVGAMPHASKLAIVKNNNCNGVIDVHFVGSKKHLDSDYGVTKEEPDERHQYTIKLALKATKYLNLPCDTGGNTGNTGTTGSTSPTKPTRYPQNSFATLHPPMLGNFTVVQGFKGRSHKGVDVQIRPWTTPAVNGGSIVMGSKYKPTVKIYSATAGTVVRVKCHNPYNTGDILSDNSEMSNHTHPYNQSTPHSYKYAEGDCVYVQSPSGKYYCYMHMYCGSVKVKKGDKVYPGTVLGYEGNTGNTAGQTGVHLHFQMNNPDFSGWQDVTAIVMLGKGIPQY